LSGYEELLAAFLDLVARDIIQGRRCNSFPCAQIETRMMPGAVHRAIDHQTFRQRAAVMCARCADGEKLFTASGHKNRFAEGVSQKHLTIAHVSGLRAFFKIRSLKLVRCFGHRRNLPQKQKCILGHPRTSYAMFSAERRWNALSSTR